MTVKTKVMWIGPGLRLLGETEGGQTVTMDHVLPGEEREEGGPRPMELLLLGLSGCTAMDVVSILQKKRQPVKCVEVIASGERADEHPKVYTHIHLEFVVYGAGVQPEAVERAIELSQTKYCPASAMLSKAVQITTSYRIVEEGN
ncbi:MAG: OsmC family protein [Anaerolineae bacterium]|nr:OsmC family protein [Anaerolineae bacterium]